MPPNLLRKSVFYICRHRPWLFSQNPICCMHPNHAATQRYTKRTISNLSQYTKISLSHLIKFCIFYHRCISRQHFLLIFSQKLSYIMVLAYHFGRGTKPAISIQKRWSLLALFGSCLCTSYVKFNEFFWLI